MMVKHTRKFGISKSVDSQIHLFCVSSMYSSNFNWLFYYQWEPIRYNKYKWSFLGGKFWKEINNEK